MAQCTAKSKRSGERCRRHAVTGRTVCMMHGGKSPVGMALPQFKTGRYSKYLPARLVDRYQEALQDSELLVLREEIALLDSRLADLLSRVDTGESGKLWKDVVSAFRQYKKARKLKDEEAMAEVLVDLEDAIEKGISDYTAWGEIGDVLEQRRKLVESERKRLVEAQQVMTAEQAMSFFSAMTAVIREHVTDREVLNRISTDFARLVNRPSNEVIDG